MALMAGLVCVAGGRGAAGSAGAVRGAAGAVAGRGGRRFRRDSRGNTAPRPACRRRRGLQVLPPSSSLHLSPLVLGLALLVIAPALAELGRPAVDSVDGSGMIASAGSAFELQVRAAAHTTSDDCGAVDRLILSDLTTNAAQVVSCTESVARCERPEPTAKPRPESVGCCRIDFDSPWVVCGQQSHRGVLSECGRYPARHIRRAPRPRSQVTSPALHIPA
eukprot:COSAG04_NODE_840_length_9955_cov_5.454038_7_plen_220_part_00